MLNDKPKKRGFRHHNRWLFLLLWLIGHGAAWGVFLNLGVFLSEFIALNSDGVGLYLLLGLTVGGITSLTQYLLMRWQFGHNLKAWVPISTLAWIFAAIVPFRSLIGDNFGDFQLQLQALALFVPATIVQIFLLGTYVRNAWLWTFANIAGISIFTLGITTFTNTQLDEIISYGGYALTTGLTLLWLFSTSQDEAQLEDYSVNLEHLSDETAEDYTHALASESVNEKVKHHAQ